MNPDPQKPLAESSRHNPFWVCCLVLLLLACDYGFRFVGLLDQRAQLDRLARTQAQNTNTLVQARQLESRLEALSIELLQIAKTNAAARQIVKDFNIQWNPNPATRASPPASSTQKQ